MILDFFGQRQVEYPSSTQVRAALMAMKEASAEGAVILKREDGWILEVHPEVDQYSLVAREGSHLAGKSKPLPLPEVVEFVLLFHGENPGWAEEVPWRALESGDMEDSEFVFHSSYEPGEGRAMLRELEQAGIPFELDLDDGIEHSAIWGSHGAMARVDIYVRQEDFPKVAEIQQRLFER